MCGSCATESINSLNSASCKHPSSVALVALHSVRAKCYPTSWGFEESNREQFNSHTSPKVARKRAQNVFSFFLFNDCLTMAHCNALLGTFDLLLQSMTYLLKSQEVWRHKESHRKRIKNSFVFRFSHLFNAHFPFLHCLARLTNQMARVNRVTTTIGRKCVSHDWEVNF